MPQQISKQLNSSSSPSSKTNVTANWWAPVWRGLVVDETAKHYQAMGNAVWLYLYLLLFARRSTGVVKRQLSTIAAHTGIKRRTLQRYLAALCQAGYVKLENSERTYTLIMEKWKPIQRRAPLSADSRKEGNASPPSASPRQPRLGSSAARQSFQRIIF